MRIYKHTPTPEPPPSTYDIAGLTEDEAGFLRDLMGRFAGGCDDLGGNHLHIKLFNELDRKLPSKRQHYDFEHYNSDTADFRRIGSLQCKQVP